MFSRSTHMATNKLITNEFAKIEKLNGINYEMSHRKIKYALIYDNLKYVIETTTPELDNNAPKAEVKKQENGRSMTKGQEASCSCLWKIVS